MRARAVRVRGNVFFYGGSLDVGEDLKIED